MDLMDLMDDGNDYYKDKVLPERLRLTDADVDAVRKQHAEDSLCDYCNMRIFNLQQHQLDEYDARMKAKDPNYKPKLYSLWGGGDANGPQQETPPSNSAPAPSLAMSPLPNTTSSPNTLSSSTAQDYDSQITTVSGNDQSEPGPSEPSNSPGLNP